VAGGIGVAAGRGQVNSSFVLFDPLIFSRCHCRYASIRTLEERSFSLGPSWAFWFQPVLLFVGVWGKRAAFEFPSLSPDGWRSC
jgi:hypothetical protein